MTHQTITTVTPRQALGFLNFRELWQYRDLLWILGLRDLKVRYKQTIIGVAWAVIQPLAMIAIFTLLFHLMGKTPADSGNPYVLTMFCALLPWQFLAASLASAGGSIVTHQNMVKKIYFPKLVLPFAAMIPAMLDYFISLGILVLMMIWYQVGFGWPILMAPVFMLLCMVLTAGISLWLSALSALYRDFMYVIPFLLQIGFFASAVIFETRAIVPEKYWVIAGLNPMVTVSEGSRWAILGGSPLPVAFWLPGTVIAVAILLSGLLYFRRMEGHFAERV